MSNDAEECPTCLVDQLVSYAHESKAIKNPDEHTLIEAIGDELASYMKRQETRTKSRRQNNMPEGILEGLIEKAKVVDTTDLALAVVGAGASASVMEVVRSWLPEQTEDLSDEAVAAIASFLLFYYGDRLNPRVTSFGFGAFLSSVGAWTSGYTAGLFEMLKKKEAAS